MSLTGAGTPMASRPLNSHVPARVCSQATSRISLLCIYLRDSDGEAEAVVPGAPGVDCLTSDTGCKAAAAADAAAVDAAAADAAAVDAAAVDAANADAAAADGLTGMETGVAVGLLILPAAIERASRALYTAPASRYIPQ